MASSSYSQPLLVFALPPDVLRDLTVRQSALSHQLPLVQPALEESSPALRPTEFGSTSCGVCVGAVFNDVQEQRDHFRSDWHRYNVRARLQNSTSLPVSEPQFAALVGGLEESISGSESDSSGSSSGSEGHDAISSLLKKTKIKKRTSEEGETRFDPRSPIVWFTSSSIPDTQYGIYRTVFSKEGSPSTYVDELREMQDGGVDGRQWAVFMTAGGHFAGAIVRVCPEDGGIGASSSAPKKHKGPANQSLELLKHKTFHRYTTRRKQGGSQSVNDNAKGPAKSAGAQLRRYGEQALKDDIRGLMEEWREDLQMSERIFIRASTSNRKIFLDFEDSPIQKGDERLRTFPFPTRRPTQAEVVRCVNELSRVKISHLTEEALAAQDQAAIDALLKPKSIPSKPSQTPTQPKKALPPKLSKEEEHVRDLWERLLDMIRKGRLEALHSFWARHGMELLGSVDEVLPEWLEGKDSGAGGTLLQFAAAAGQQDIVRWLLEELRADPTKPVPPSFTRYRPPEDDENGSTYQTAYTLATTQETRDVFRKCSYLHPDWYEWREKALVTSVLSPEMEAREAKRKQMREKAKARETAAAQVEEELPEPVAPPKAAERRRPERTTPGAQRVGDREATERDRLAVAGLTPEMRAKIERERRARAAEARMASSQQSR